MNLELKNLLGYGIINFFLSQISEEDIVFHESYEISNLLDMDYPPRIVIFIRDSPKSPDSEPLRLHLEGLNKEYTFTVLPGINIRIVYISHPN